MNSYFGCHAIITIEANERFMTLRTLDALHGHSCRMFIDSDRLYRWLDKPDTSSFMDYDCGSFVIMHRRNDNVHAHQTWVQSDCHHGIRGYTQDFDLVADDLLAVLVAGVRIRKLTELEGKRGQAEITITNGAQRQIRKLDKLQRRALSKALRDSFKWKDSHVCLYADWGNDFAFVEQQMSGGLCLHETKVIGRDGKFHRKVCYQVHT